MPTSNARIGYKNLLENGAIVASSEDADFPVANIADWLPNDFFKPAASGTINIDLTLSGTDSADSNDIKWYEFIEKLLGKTTIQTRSESESDRSKGKGKHEAARSLMSAPELAGLKFEECVGLFRSRKGRIKVRGPKPFYIRDDEVRFY